MSRVQKVSCELADDREVYMPGEAVNGQWVVTVGEFIQVTGIRISFVGITYVKWSEGLSVRANRSRDVITNQWTDVLEEVNCKYLKMPYAFLIGGCFKLVCALS